jgi:hypothetical protein
VIRLNQESGAIEMSNNLIRWSGLAYLLAGLSLIAQQIYELVGPDPTSPGWVAIHTLGYLGLALGLIGLVGIYLAQRNEVGRLGTIGFVLGFLGNALTIGAAFLNTFLVPVLTNAAPDLLSPAGPLFTGPMGMIILLSAVMVTLGFVLFGIATMRAGVLPRWAALLVTISAWFGLAAVFSPVAFAIGGILFGLGNAWLGYAVWSSVGHPRTLRQPKPAT